MLPLAPVNQASCRPEARTVWSDAMPDSGAGLPVTQFHLSPPSEPTEAPAGSESSIQTWVGLFAWKVPSAKRRRPSGHSTSASTHCGPLLTGDIVKDEPNAGCWSRPSQTILEPARSIPLVLSVSVTGV